MPVSIYPYLYLDESIWVFDDERVGLKEEAFVSGASEMISRLVETKGIPNAGRGFAMTFSAEPFAGHDVELNWLRADEPESVANGNWYRGAIAGQMMECWLCPALFCFFPTAPKLLYVRADPLPPGIDPIWHVAPDDPGQRRFMSPGDDQDRNDENQ